MAQLQETNKSRKENSGFSRADSSASTRVDSGTLGRTAATAAGRVGLAARHQQVALNTPSRQSSTRERPSQVAEIALGSGDQKVPRGTKRSLIRLEALGRRRPRQQFSNLQFNLKLNSYNWSIRQAWLGASDTQRKGYIRVRYNAPSLTYWVFAHLAPIPGFRRRPDFRPTSRAGVGRCIPLGGRLGGFITP